MVASVGPTAIPASAIRSARGFVQLAVHQEALRADVTADQAADLLWLLTSFDSFDLLYTGRNLSIEDRDNTDHHR
jgi:hypothetical protein